MSNRSCESDPKEAFDVKAFFERIATETTSERFQKDQKIYVQGEIADSICYLGKGRVKAIVLSDLGKEAIVGIFHEGQFFGEACLGIAKFRTTTMVAMEECLVTAVKKQKMLSALDSNHQLSAFFVTQLLSRNARLEENLADQLLNSSERRLARLLLVLASPYREGEKPVTITLSQEVLAEMVGTTRSRVSTFMNKFREKGFVSYDNHSGRIQVYAAALLSMLEG
jgi:CRP/FNR family transcriptional regulator, cyclic AMP receptor protein